MATSIPVNPRTSRPVGYAFVDLATAEQAASAIEELSGKEILQRKVSVQLARKSDPADADGEGRKKAGGRGKVRGRTRRDGGRPVCVPLYSPFCSRLLADNGLFFTASICKGSGPRARRYR